MNVIFLNKIVIIIQQYIFEVDVVMNTNKVKQAYLIFSQTQFMITVSNQPFFYSYKFIENSLNKNLELIS